MDKQSHDAFLQLVDRAGTKGVNVYVVQLPHCVAIRCFRFAIFFVKSEVAKEKKNPNAQKTTTTNKP